jgi:hypothetical protein
MEVTVARSRRIVTGRMQRRLSNRLGFGFTVERVTVRGVSGKQDWRKYAAFVIFRYGGPSRFPHGSHAFTVQAEGRTCPYDVLVIKARMLAGLS